MIVLQRKIKVISIRTEWFKKVCLSPLNPSCRLSLSYPRCLLSCFCVYTSAGRLLLMYQGVVIDKRTSQYSTSLARLESIVCMMRGKWPYSCLFVLFILFTNPSARAGYDTRSIFKRSLTGLNSEFSFS